MPYWIHCFGLIVLLFNPVVCCTWRLKGIPKTSVPSTYCLFFHSEFIFQNREVKFKRALRLQFWLNLQNLFCCFLTSKLWSDPYMINPSIKSFDFLFWHEKILNLIFEDFVGNRQTKFHILKFRVCVNTHSIWTCEIQFVCFPQIFNN